MIDDPQNFAAQLAALQRNYASKLQGRVDDLYYQWLLLRDQWQPQTLELLYREVHTLAGSSLSYGFKQLGGIVKQLEYLLQPLAENQQLPDEQKVQRIDQLFNQLKQVVVHVEDEL